MSALELLALGAAAFAVCAVVAYVIATILATLLDFTPLGWSVAGEERAHRDEPPPRFTGSW